MLDIPHIQQLRRSALFVPADKQSAINKATHLGVDILILDLEDAVAPQNKTEARANIASAISAFKASGSISAIRVSEPGSRNLEDDLVALSEAEPDAVLISKLDDLESLRAVRAQLLGANYSGPLWAMIESPQGIIGLEAMIEQVRMLNLEMVIVGLNDLAKSLKIPQGPHKRAALEPHTARILLAARAANIPVLDGVYNAYQDEAGFIADAELARALGFDGKSLIHPNQVELANQIFVPSETDISWARTIIEAYEKPENETKGAISVGGQMIERLHLSAAQNIMVAAEKSKAA